MTESHRRPWRPSRLQVISASIIGGLVIVVGLAVALTLATGPVVPRGTTVSGVDIGGLGRDAAIEKVRADVARPAAEPLEFDNAGEVLIVRREFGSTRRRRSSRCYAPPGTPWRGSWRVEARLRRS